MSIRQKKKKKQTITSPLNFPEVVEMGETIKTEVVLLPLQSRFL